MSASARKKKVLWITPKWPLPADDGQRIATLSLLENITGGCDVDLIAFAKTGEQPDPQELSARAGVKKAKILFIPKRQVIGAAARAVQGLFRSTCLPITLSRFADPGAQAEADLWLRTHGPWDALVFDTLHVSALFFRAQQLIRPDFAKQIFYRAHNVESDLWYMSATKSLWLRLFFRSQGNLVKRYEQSLLQICDRVFPVSQPDLDKLRSFHEKINFELLPIGFSFPTPSTIPLEGTSTRLLFLGRLDWPPNRDGLRWFLEKIWTKARARQPNLQLLIAGSGEHGWMRKFAKLPGITFFGRVEDIPALYSQASAVILPLFYGSGIRVKAVEAALYGKSILSTQLGVQGLGLVDGQSYLRADAAAEWLLALAALERPESRNLGARAFRQLSQTHDARSIGQQLLNRL